MKKVRAIEMFRNKIFDKIRRYNILDLLERFKFKRSPVLTLNDLKEIKSVLILRRGLIGDTVVAIPALKVLKRELPNAEFTYVSDSHPTKKYVSAESVLNGTGLVNHYVTWCYFKNPFFNLLSILQLFSKLFSKRWDLGILLEKGDRDFSHIKRDIHFLNLLGVSRVISDRAVERMPRDKNGMLLRVPHEADYLMGILKQNGFPIPEINKGDISIVLPEKNVLEADRWIEEKLLKNKLLMAVGIGSNMQAKKWHIDKYMAVVDKIKRAYNILPIVVGGKKEVEEAEYLIKKWGYGVSAAGQFSLQESAALLSQCMFYLGNDTGLHHIASSVGIPCVVIFSARDNPGRWEPYGEGHKVLRYDPECAGCMRYVCDKTPSCLDVITVDAVYSACIDVIEKNKISGYCDD